MSAVDRIPGLTDLLHNVGDHPDPELAEKAAGNAILPLSFGVQAIGKLLYSAAANQDAPPDRDTLEDIGCLLEELGGLIYSVHKFAGAKEYQDTVAKMMEDQRKAR